VARKVGLRRDEVIAAAVALADREGLDSVTLARLASQLGVRPPSLYSHVDGQAGLRRAMSLEAAHQLAMRISEAIGDRAGVEALTELAHAYRRFVLQHPGLYATLLPAPSRHADQELHDAFAAPVVAIAQLLVSMGVPNEDTVDSIRTLRSAIHGFVSLEVGGGFAMPDDIDRSFSTLITTVVTGIASLAAQPRRRQTGSGRRAGPNRRSAPTDAEPAPTGPGSADQQFTSESTSNVNDGTQLIGDDDGRRSPDLPPPR
jgi:AcrR family transcriptional regulator